MMTMNVLCRTTTRRLAINSLARSSSRSLSSLGDTLKAKEMVEENLFIKRQTEEQLDKMRKDLHEKTQLKAALWEEVRMENTLADVQYILRDEHPPISLETMRRLAQWKLSSE